MPEYLRLSPGPCFRRCFADTCDATVQRDELMCREHWRHVPAPIRMEVLNAMQELRIRGEISGYAEASVRAQLAVAAAMRKGAQ